MKILYVKFLCHQMPFLLQNHSLSISGLFSYGTSLSAYKKYVWRCMLYLVEKIYLKVVSTDYQTKNQKIVQAQLTRKENCIMTLFVFLCELIRAFLARMCSWLTRDVFFFRYQTRNVTQAGFIPPDSSLTSVPQIPLFLLHSSTHHQKV